MFSKVAVVPFFVMVRFSRFVLDRGWRFSSCRTIFASAILLVKWLIFYLCLFFVDVDCLRWVFSCCWVGGFFSCFGCFRCFLFLVIFLPL